MSQNKFVRLENEDVITKTSSYADPFHSGLPPTFKSIELKRKIQAWVYQALQKNPSTGFFVSDDGQSGFKVLKQTGGGWKQGRMRMTIEFCSDEPEDNAKNIEPIQEKSPLDEIRKSIQ
ncbi:MAG: hypothetical protein DSM107014_08725 [Gomphosphaeria aponina SAG 52.96 = DSM 107014]|uniref:KGK family protein n=1 Tax=Gomphosphaeria aponina SAG 52.96 = DSM 107014 TaxID=1521640 RepID=A0A941JM96_9CHRO|nr:hypothetical protein [Gomphosphaeria aponina SAG 52.96 = DSM 107014]